MVKPHADPHSVSLNQELNKSHINKSETVSRPVPPDTFQVFLLNGAVCCCWNDGKLCSSSPAVDL